MKVMYETSGKAEYQFPADTGVLRHKFPVTAAVFRGTTKILTVDMTLLGRLEVRVQLKCDGTR
jgi:hypothetical protein